MESNNYKLLTEIVRKEIRKIFSEMYGNNIEANASYPWGSIEYPLFEPWNEPADIDDVETNAVEEHPFYKVSHIDFNKNSLEKLNHSEIKKNLTKSQANIMVKRLNKMFPKETFYFDVDTSLN